MAYCALADVKRILRVLDVSSDNQHKIRFSDSYTLPESYSSNSGDCTLSGISTVLTSYAGNEFWKIVFTSATTFTLYRDEEAIIEDGDGFISADFVSTSQIISIDATEWSGTPVAGDKIKFQTNSNMSSDDVDDFIADADAIVDGHLNKYIKSSALPFSTVPALISRASMYLTANLIFTSVFSTLSTDEVPTLIRRWYTFSNNLVKTYIESIASKTNHNYLAYGRFASRKPLFDKVGIEEAAGVEGMSGEIETVNVDYDADNNSKEAIGSN
jgi:hypothetical protein